MPGPDFNPLLQHPLDLYGHTLRGLVIGVASLAWHGHGFATGAPRAEVVRVLNYLRDKGQMTTSNLTRFGKVAKVERNTLLDHFVARESGARRREERHRDDLRGVRHRPVCPERIGR